MRSRRSRGWSGRRRRREAAPGSGRRTREAAPGFDPRVAPAAGRPCQGSTRARAPAAGGRLGRGAFCGATPRTIRRETERSESVPDKIGVVGRLGSSTNGGSTNAERGTRLDERRAGNEDRTGSILSLSLSLSLSLLSPQLTSLRAPGPCNCTPARTSVHVELLATAALLHSATVSSPGCWFSSRSQSSLAQAASGPQFGAAVDGLAPPWDRAHLRAHRFVASHRADRPVGKRGSARGARARCRLGCPRLAPSRTGGGQPPSRVCRLRLSHRLLLRCQRLIRRRMLPLPLHRVRQRRRRTLPSLPPVKPLRTTTASPRKTPGTSAGGTPCRRPATGTTRPSTWVQDPDPLRRPSMCRAPQMTHRRERDRLPRRERVESRSCPTLASRRRTRSLL